ncbi:hypothetical protein M885DRAFT_525767 [Pelagophyceae sp. CCMP2097]|nr:hypothetical protein M885DRAFT_525767 [Pelagophyceae sp. CCMP2097]|mmetsp:Transcript_2269/g.8082  ORF Transcript_2269/g.8082 Transcript_2269/m.8082 type:complete len:337 (+) Transcript_2269:61-1071(+)
MNAIKERLAGAAKHPAAEAEAYTSAIAANEIALANECALADARAMAAEERAAEVDRDAKARVSAAEAQCIAAKTAASEATEAMHAAVGEMQRVATQAAAETARAQVESARAQAEMARAKPELARAQAEIKSAAAEIARAEAIALAAATAMERATKLETELAAANEAAEQHRQKRLAQRGELLSVVKVLEGARHSENMAERNCRDKLAPQLVGHSENLQKLVDLAQALAAKRGAVVAPVAVRTPLTTESTKDAPPAYVQQLQVEVDRAENGLVLLQQTLEALELAMKPSPLCALLSWPLEMFRKARAPPQEDEAVKPPRRGAGKGGYAHVDEDVEEL